MKAKVLRIFENLRDNVFLFIGYIITFLFICSIGVVMAIRAPGFLKFVGVGVIVGSFYFLTYYPTFKTKINNKD